MKRHISLLIFILLLLMGKVSAQCIGDFKVSISPGDLSICYNTSPGKFTVTASGETGSYTYLWYKNSVATGITSQEYDPGILTATTTIYCAVTSGTCGPLNSSTTTVTVTPVPTATISYPGSPFCKSISTPQHVFLTGTSGGTFSASPSGLSIISGNGDITPSTSNTGTYTVTYTIPASGGCSVVQVTTFVTIVAVPTAPIIGLITQPTCFVSTGSVALSGLPSTGDWLITRKPDGVTSTGNGSSTVISGILPGTYTFTVAVASSPGCISPESSSAKINTQPVNPNAPLVGTITVPTCAVPTGSVFLSGLPATGSWTLTRYPGSVATGGSGSSTTISGLSPNTYNYTVTNSDGCISGLSANIIIPAPPSAPSAPVVGAITQPTCSVATGSVILSGLPAGNWTINPGGITGSTSSTTVSGLASGTYNFIVTNSVGCTSLPSANVIINAQPVTPTAPVVGLIIQTTCSVPTGSVTLNGLPAGNWTLIRNPGAIASVGTGASTTISGLTPGTFTFTVTNAAGCTSLSSGNVVINAQPPSPSTPIQSVDCSLGFGNAIVTVTSPVGTGLEYSIDGSNLYQTTTSFIGVANGNHIIAVRNAAGCTTIGPLFSVSCGCVNPPTLILSSNTGITCGTTPVTVSGNIFGGTATSVTITENGAGAVTPASSAISPFAFTYTPAVADGGRTVIITVTTNNPLGVPCAAAVETYTLTVNAIPSAPTIGTITHLTCTEGTGSVILNGLPSTGTWTLTRSPGSVVTSGSGTSTTVTGLAAGTYNFTITSTAGCTSVSSANVVINPQPSSPTAPVIGTITQPTCAISTGSVFLSDLPAGSWTITRMPGAVTRTGSGTSVTISTIPAGTFTFTVTNSTGCISPPSENVVINAQPPVPTAPSAGTIAPPTCTLSTGSVVLLGLPSTGTWTLTRYPGSVTSTGTGTSTTITDLPSGIYNYTVANAEGCISASSENMVIPAQPPTPSAPVVGTITQPTFSVPFGSVVLSGLPSGPWVITRLPGDVTTTGTGSSRIISDLLGGLYTFTVTNSSGCTSAESSEVIISTPGVPVVIITDPPAECFPATVDLTDPSIKEGSTTGLTYSYWADSLATVPYSTPSVADSGTYYIKGTTVSGYFDIKPVMVTVDHIAIPFAGEDQILYYILESSMDAELTDDYETGVWSVLSGSGEFIDTTYAKTSVSGLSLGENQFLWKVTRGACPPSYDTVSVIVNDLLIPTLITPNMDGRNDYLVIRGLNTLGKTELIIFDRRGAQVYKNADYDNSWDGVDYNENPLPDDTYFYVLKSRNGKSISGYIVIRR